MASAPTLTLLTIAFLYGALSNASADDTFKLLVLHTNDMHARFEQTNSFGGKCNIKSKGGCYGGFPRLISAVKDIRQRSKDHVLFLNAGDTYQGTVWYTAHKWSVVAHFINLLGLDVMSLGNHEFDDGVEGLVPFLRNTTVPAVAANLDLSLEPTLMPYVKPSVTLNINGTLIGVIGYLTPATKDISEPGNVKLLPEVDSVAKEAAKLKSEGVKILIALGHSGYKTDLEIARLVPDIDLVVGGHTNTFLYTGPKPDLETPVDKYPKIVVQQSGRKVPVVQAYAFTKYLGFLHLTFNNDGELLEYKGNPILLDHEVPEDEKILDELEPWYHNVSTLVHQVTGRTRVYLDGSQKSCRNVECNLGNLITDAMIYYNFESYRGEGWTDGAIAFQHGGGIRTSIDESEANGEITLADVLTVLPFENPVVLVEILGKHIIDILEFSAAFHDPNGLSLGGGFLQFSGLYVRYNMSNPIGNRTLEVKVRCAACRTPSLLDINRYESYGILMPRFLVGGGDGYSVIKNNIISYKTLDKTDTEILVNYLNKKSPILHGTEWRIQIVDEPSKNIDLINEPLASTAEVKINSGSTFESHRAHCIIILTIFILTLI